MRATFCSRTRNTLCILLDTLSYSGRIVGTNYAKSKVPKAVQALKDGILFTIEKAGFSTLLFVETINSVQNLP